MDNRNTKGINMLKKIILYLNFVILSIMPVAAQNYAPDELINISVYEKINPAIVSIDANLDDGFSAGTKNEPPGSIPADGLKKGKRLWKRQNGNFLKKRER